jgi:hypothetical protein
MLNGMLTLRAQLRRSLPVLLATYRTVRVFYGLEVAVTQLRIVVEYVGFTRTAIPPRSSLSIVNAGPAWRSRDLMYSKIFSYVMKYI